MVSTKITDAVDHLPEAPVLTLDRIAYVNCFFPILTSAVWMKFIDQSHSDSHMSALVSFRSWVRKTLER